MTAQPVFVDQDGGIDDALAMALVQHDPRAEIVGVGSVHGNVDAGRAAQHGARIGQLVGASDVPVAVGAGRSLDGALHVAHPGDVLGRLIGRPRPWQAAPVDAADHLLDLSHKHAGDLHVLALGPLTNLALALMRDPTLVERVPRVVLMGGAWRAPGNATAVAESNVWHDPRAAEVVLAARFSDVTVVPLDVTRRATVGRLVKRCALARFVSHRDHMPTSTAAGRARVKLRRTFPIHDVVAAAVLLDPERAQTERCPVTVECAGDDVGRLRRAQDWRPAARIAWHVDVDDLISRLIRALWRRHR